MQKFNYHSHTALCKHAIGTYQEYVDNAITAGLDTIGFSDHVPYKNVSKSDRMEYYQKKTYEEAVLNLKDQYKNKIKVLLGYECEFFPDYLPYYQQLAKETDYLILGQHYAAIDGTDYYINCDNEEVMEYADLISKGLDTGLFKYLAHIDYFMISRSTFNESCKQAVIKIAKACIRNDVVIEINLKGKTLGKKMIDGKMQYRYPLRAVFEIIAEYGCKCVYGQDTHNPSFYLRFYDDIAQANEILAGLDLNLVESLAL